MMHTIQYDIVENFSSKLNIQLNLPTILLNKKIVLTMEKDLAKELHILSLSKTFLTIPYDAHKPIKKYV